MPKKAPRITNSAVNKGSRQRATLDYWVGTQQHSGDGSSTDPEHENAEPNPAGTVHSKVFRHPGAKA